MVEVGTFVAEHGAVDAALPLSSADVEAIVDELAPDKHSLGALGPKHNLFARADELRDAPAFGVSTLEVVPLVECEAINIAVLGQPPVSHVAAAQPSVRGEGG